MNGTTCFILASLILLAGYLFYGRLVERILKPRHDHPLPSETKADGVDYVALPRWKIFLIQLLNIAGLGPVFGALSGALFGPAALLWIVIGCIIGGATHDFLAAMMSAHHEGENLPETVGRYLGHKMGHILRLLCVALCTLVGVVFTLGPAGMLAALPDSLSILHWSIIIFGYYFLATILPIQTIIGRIYPFFGALFIFMAISVIVMLFVNGYDILPNTDFFANTHPNDTPIWPALFVTIACGAISGFHATQSPLMVRCLPRVRDGRPLFYGAMIAEGFVALIWATVGLSFYQGPEALAASMYDGTPSSTVTQVCTTLLGPTGAVIALLGVVVLPITSGDTALRCSRLMLADMLKLPQKPIRNRLILALPLFAIAISLTQVDFQIVWRYFGWFNQAIAAITLWTISVFLRKRGSWHWITTVPAMFMTAMCITYLLCSKESFGMDMMSSTAAGIIAAMLLAALFMLHIPDETDE